MPSYIPLDGWEMSLSNHRALTPHESRLAANRQAAALKSTYSQPLLSGEVMIAQFSTQRAHRHCSTSEPDYCFSSRKMEEDYRPMSEQERRDMDIEIKRIRLEEMGYILSGIPVDVAHGERIAMRQERTGFADPLGRFRAQRQASTQSPNSGNGFSPPPEPVSPQQSTATSGALIQVIHLCATYQIQRLNCRRKSRESMSLIHAISL